MTDQLTAHVALTENPLSEREMEVARLLVTGASNAEIARDLVISPHTVKVHLRNIFEKLQVGSRTEASLLLLQKGWIIVPGVELSPTEAARRAVPDPDALADLPAHPAAWQKVVLLGVVVFALAILWAPGLFNRPQTQPDLLTDAGLTPVAPPTVRTLPRWTARTPLPQPLSRLAAVAAGDRLYLIGGESHDGRVVDALTAYDLKVNEWASLPPLPLPLANAAAVAVENRIFVAGGSTAVEDGQEPALSDKLWAYDIKAAAWTEFGTLPNPLAGMAMVTDGTALYIMGGWDGASVRSEVWRYRPAAKTPAVDIRWELVTRMETPRAFFGAALFDEEIYIAGGYDGQRELDLAAVYSMQTNRWRPLPSLSSPRSGLSVVYDGLALFALGGGWRHPIDTHERYDPSLNVWSNFPSPIQGEWRHLAATGSGDRIYVLGGWSGDYLDTHLEYQSSFRSLLPVISND